MASLSNTSVEIAINIFQNLDDLQDVKALLSTNAKFYSIWKENTTAIIPTVLPLAISFYPLARSLREAEKKASGYRPDTLVDPLIEDVREMVRNAGSVGFYCNKYRLDSRSMAREQLARSIYDLWIAMEENPFDKDSTRDELIKFFSRRKVRRKQFQPVYLAIVY